MNFRMNGAANFTYANLRRTEMLIPKLDMHEWYVEDQMYVGQRYFVYDTEKEEFLKTKSFKAFETRQECQDAIDFFNSLQLLDAS